MISEFMRKAPRDTQIDAWDLITLFLMFERQVGRESKYAPFIQSMPFFFTNPIAWPEEYFDLFPEQTKRAVMDSLKDAKIRFTRLEKVKFLSGRELRLLTSVYRLTKTHTCCLIWIGSTFYGVNVVLQVET